MRESSYNLANGTTGFCQDHFPKQVSKNGTPVSLNRNHDNLGNFANGCGFALDTITDYMILKITVDDTALNPWNSRYQIGRNETLSSGEFDIAEIIGYDSELSSADETAVGAYLTTKYRLSTAYVVSGSYATWAGPDGYNLTGGPGDDEDSDGITNLMEYGLGLNPTVPTGWPGTLTGNLLGFTKGTQAVNNGDVTYSIQTSRNLQDPWTTVVTHAPGNTDPTISCILPAGQGKIFARLKVTDAPYVASANYTAWAIDNAGGEDANLDFDHDGVPNGVEYFMGQTGSSFTPNPSPDSTGKITWPRDPNASATFVVQVSTNLLDEVTPGDGGWAAATSGVVDNGTSVEFSLPQGNVRYFVRIRVTVTP